MSVVRALAYGDRAVKTRQHSDHVSKSNYCDTGTRNKQYDQVVTVTVKRPRQQ
jgi:hypothetical protein